MAFAFYNPDTATSRLIWWCAIAAVLLARALDIAYWTKYLRHRSYNLTATLRRFQLGCLLTATLWSSFALMLFNTMSDIEFATTFIVLCAMAGGASTILAADKMSALLYGVILILPFSLCSMFSELPHRQILGALGCISCMLMAAGSIKAAKFTTNAIAYKNQNADLLRQMQKEQDAVKRANANLEDKVQRRTRRIYELSNIDPLTNLPNRSAFSHALNELLGYCQEKQQQLALLFIDLDGFKKVNDTLGHDIGDDLLIETAQRIKAAAGDEAYYCRWGGDEFLLALPSVTEEEALETARILTTALAAPIISQNHNLKISATIGIALYPEHGTTEERLIQLADTAMFNQKRMAGNEPRMFCESMHLAMQREQMLKAGLSRAIENDELSLHYQPIVDAQNGELCCMEALLRWHHQGQWISPFEFIGIAERSGLIQELGLWVLKQSVRDATQWQDNLPGNPKVGVNVSVAQLLSEGFGQEVQTVLQQTGLPPEQLHIEITESLFAEEPQLVSQQLQALRSQGIKIAIDDFGTGFSSLSQLQNLAVDMIKIDRSFVNNMAGQGTTIIQAINHLARELDYQVIAEGVETEEQLRHLQYIGVQQIQGYFYAKPMPLDELNTWYQAFSPIVSTRQGLPQEAFV